MSRFQKSESLFAVFVVIDERVFHAVQGQGQQLGILYLGSANDGPPANANAVLAGLRDEVLAEPEDAAAAETQWGKFSVAGSKPPDAPPWTLTIHLEEGGDEHLWVARDFKSRDEPIPAAGVENRAMLIFTSEAPADIDAIDNLTDIEAIAKSPTRVTLYAAGDAPGLGNAARDYGAAVDLDD